MEVRSTTEPDKFNGPAAYHVLHTSGALDAGAAIDAPVETDQRGQGTWNTFTANVSMVRYEPAVRSHWHSHSGGQMLYIVEGTGWVQTRGEAPIEVASGDSISFAPGEVHWHGAGDGSPLAHLAVTTGKPTWYEPAESPA